MVCATEGRRASWGHRPKPAGVAGRARIANEHSIRRFRAELRNADVSDLCLEAIGVDRDQAIGREPPSPGATGS